jgi:hypothetical protein
MTAPTRSAKENGGARKALALEKLCCREEKVESKLVVAKVFVFFIDVSFQTLFLFIGHVNLFNTTNLSEYVFDFWQKCRRCIKWHPFKFHLEISEKPKIVWCNIGTIRKMG